MSAALAMNSYPGYPPSGTRTTSRLRALPAAPTLADGFPRLNSQDDSRPEASAESPLPPQPSQRWPRVDSMPGLGPFVDAPGIVRSQTTLTLIEWKLRSLIDDALTIVSELVTNAVQASVDPGTADEEYPVGHPRLVGGTIPAIWVRLRSDGSRLLIEVWDAAAGMPVTRDADVGDDSGRGLAIVSLLCADHGCTQCEDGGKVSWALLTLRGTDYPARKAA